MCVTLPAVVRTDSSGMAVIARLMSGDDLLEIDVSNLRHLDDNLCAALGVVHATAAARGRAIRIVGNLADDLRRRLLETSFLPHVINEDIPSLSSTFFSATTKLPYRQFGCDDIDSFISYIDWIFSSGKLPEMTAGVRNKLRESFVELFLNVIEHSESHLGVFVCGYHSLERQTLALSIADAGIGMQKRVRKSLGRELSPCEAITWALKRGNTTRKTPGGLGLDILVEFIKKNEGRLVVWSGFGYLDCQKETVFTDVIENEFQGTVVTAVINTADTKSYYLRSEAET